jgi:hypothetical protein
MKMKIDQILTAIKIGIGVAKSLATGKVAKGLEKADIAVDIAKAVKKTIKAKK